jgi:hypothetical protein
MYTLFMGCNLVILDRLPQAWRWARRDISRVDIAGSGCRRQNRTEPEDFEHRVDRVNTYIISGILFRAKSWMSLQPLVVTGFWCG